jgi:hypothetical protein
MIQQRCGGGEEGWLSLSEKETQNGSLIMADRDIEGDLSSADGEK